MSNGIPKQALEQERLAEEAYNKTKESVSSPAPQETVTPPVEPETVNPTIPTAETATQEVPQQEVKTDEATWEHKYKSLQGKYNKETGELRKQISLLLSEYNTLKEEITNTKNVQVPTNNVAPVTASDIDIKKYLNATDIETYGEDFLKKAAQLANGIAEEKLNRVQQETSKIKDDLSLENFVARLRDRVPDFDTLNNDANFIEWLDKKDEYGYSKREALDRNVANRNSDYIVNIFNAYKKETAPVNTSNKPNIVPESRNIAPTKTSATQVANAPSKPLIKMAEYQTIMKDISLGRYMPARAEALQKELDDAYREGRIII